MPDVAALVSLLRLATKDRSQLVLENIAPRHRLAVYKRSVGRPNIRDRDRIFWLTLMRVLREWREALVMVQPDTVVRWHRRSFQGEAAWMRLVAEGGHSRGARPCDGSRARRRNRTRALRVGR